MKTVRNDLRSADNSERAESSRVAAITRMQTRIAAGRGITRAGVTGNAE
jgi:hypothetical protein